MASALARSESPFPRCARARSDRRSGTSADRDPAVAGQGQTLAGDRDGVVPATELAVAAGQALPVEDPGPDAGGIVGPIDGHLRPLGGQFGSDAGEVGEHRPVPLGPRHLFGVPLGPQQLDDIVEGRQPFVDTSAVGAEVGLLEMAPPVGRGDHEAPTESPVLPNDLHELVDDRHRLADAAQGEEAPGGHPRHRPQRTVPELVGQPDGPHAAFVPLLDGVRGDLDGPEGHQGQSVGRRRPGPFGEHLDLGEEGGGLVVEGDAAVLSGRPEPPEQRDQDQPGVDRQPGCFRCAVDSLRQGTDPAPVTGGLDGIAETGPLGGAGVPPGRAQEVAAQFEVAGDER